MRLILFKVTIFFFQLELFFLYLGDTISDFFRLYTQSMHYWFIKKYWLANTPACLPHFFDVEDILEVYLDSIFSKVQEERSRNYIKLWPWIEIE